MIDYEIYNQIKEYANAHYKNSKDLYEKRNQDPSEIFTYIINGKVAEWCAYESLLEFGYIVDPPCMKILDKKDKSHEADLLVHGKDNILFKEKIHVHVKSVKRYKKLIFPLSFYIQRSDPLVKRPKENHYFFVMMKEDEYTYYPHKFICSTEADFLDPVGDYPTNYRVEV